jgi:glutathione S-transferase/RNA polymerase-associated protein
MKLFDHPLSPYAFKVRATLYAKGIEVEHCEIWHESQRAELVRVNPRGEVPALQDGDTVVYDSTIICDYLEETHPTPPLLPADPAARARCRALELICDTQVDACVLIIALLKIFRPAMEAQFPEALAKGVEILNKLHGDFESALEGREYFTGALSRADIALYPHLSAAAFIGCPVGPEHSRLAEWLARAGEQPSLKRAFQESMAAFERSQKETDQFFNEERLHWRSDRIEMALRCGLGQWLLEELEAGRGFLPPVPA